ncbi:hypothetical protein RJ640_001042 [Escallonia rubra]|uniref:SWIM-type domain-containing protein n=1 Tax=Escallonia rubra TaxID=112253 RepID=A0AA88QWU3_9ASTE|nr:hypothetical protein RJ640_001042 [Escallonia rubra]
MYPQKQINVFKRITREWFIWPTHEKQEGIHPPFNKFAMKGDMNSNFLATPLKHIVDTSTSNHLNFVTAGENQSLAEQSNYTNIILSTIGEQTTRIEDTIFQVKDVVSDFYSKMQPPKGISDNIFGTSPSFNLASSSSSVARNIEQPLIKPSIDLDSRFKLNSEEPSGEFLKELMTKLGQIKTPKEKYPKVETSQSSPKHINMIGDIGSESEIEPDKLEQQFITTIGASNSRPPHRNYYTRPTPVDMQLEGNNFSNPSSFNGSSIYEWNLDGMTDYQVITLLQHMLMAANSARNRNLGESEAVIARYLIAGFTGQLRGWWDFYLTPTDQNNILNSIKIEPNGNPILVNEQPLSDAVTTLVTAITKHFIGNANSEDDHSLELNNIEGDINSSCSSSNHSSDHEDTCHDCNNKIDYYKAILDMNGLSINVITSEESIILDLLDKIDDPEKKKQVIFKSLHGKQSPPTPNDSSPFKEHEILSIDRVVFQKWYVSVKIVISKDFTFEGIALIDSGADLNCIKEGLVPTNFQLIEEIDVTEGLTDYDIPDTHVRDEPKVDDVCDLSQCDDEITRVVNVMKPSEEADITPRQFYNRRYTEEDEDFKTMNSRAVLSFDHPIEATAGECYTCSLFEIFKKEWNASVSCLHITLNKEPDVTTYRVGLTTVDKESWQTVHYYSSESVQATCSCAKFETTGLLCKHILYILKKKEITDGPEYYILPRWKIHARYKLGDVGDRMDEIGSHSTEKGVSLLTLWSVRAKFSKAIDNGRYCPPNILEFDAWLSSFLEKQAARNNMEKLVGYKMVSQVGSSTCVSPMENMHQISIRDPAATIKTKGRQRYY